MELHKGSMQYGNDICMHDGSHVKYKDAFECN